MSLFLYLIQQRYYLITFTRPDTIYISVRTVRDSDLSFNFRLSRKEEQFSTPVVGDSSTFPGVEDRKCKNPLGREVHNGPDERTFLILYCLRYLTVKTLIQYPPKTETRTTMETTLGRWYDTRREACPGTPFLDSLRRSTPQVGVRGVGSYTDGAPETWTGCPEVRE